MRQTNNNVCAAWRGAGPGFNTCSKVGDGGICQVQGDQAKIKHISDQLRCHDTDIECWCQTISPSGRDSLVYLQQKPTSRRCITPNNSKFSKPIEYCKIFDEVHSSQRKAMKNLPLDSKTRHLKLHFLNLSGAVGDLRIPCRGNLIHH